MSNIIKKFVRKVIIWSLSEDLLEFSLEVDRAISNKIRPLGDSIEYMDYYVTVIMEFLKEKGIELDKEDNNIIH